MADQNGRCWFTLDPAAKPVGPYTAQEIASECVTQRTGVRNSSSALHTCAPRAACCAAVASKQRKCRAVLTPAPCLCTLPLTTDYASAGLVMEAQVFWREGSAAWEKLADIPELSAAHAALVAYRQQHGAPQLQAHSLGCARAHWLAWAAAGRRC